MFADGGRWWLGNLGDVPAIDVSASVVVAEGARLVQIDDFTLPSLGDYEQRCTEPTSHEGTAVTVLVTWSDRSSEAIRTETFNFSGNGLR